MDKADSKQRQARGLQTRTNTGGRFIRQSDPGDKKKQKQNKTKKDQNERLTCGSYFKRLSSSLPPLMPFEFFSYSQPLLLWGCTLSFAFSLAPYKALEFKGVDVQTCKLLCSREHRPLWSRFQQGEHIANS